MYGALLGTAQVDQADVVLVEDRMRIGPFLEVVVVMPYPLIARANL